MSRRNLLPFLAAFFYVSGHSFAQDTVDNGGDSIFCEEIDELGLSRGLYSLDYVLTLERDTSNDIQVSSWTQSLDRLLRLTASKFPDLNTHLLEFMNDFENFDDFRRARLWRWAPAGLIDLPDEDMIRQVPEECGLQNEGHARPQVIQSIIRTSRENLLIYTVDVNSYRVLKEDAPLQFSYLIVHEWLRDFSNDVRAIRSVNRFLHSRMADELSPEEFQNVIANFGVIVQPLGVSICERSQPMVQEILRQVTSRDCRSVPSEELSSIVSIESNRFDGKVLRPGDFAGLEGLRKLDLAGSSVSGLWPQAFSGTPNLQLLNLNGASIVVLPPDAFAGTLQTFDRRYCLRPGVDCGLDLTAAGIEEIDPDAFRGLGNIRDLNLSMNHIRAIPPQEFRHLSNLEVLNLFANRISRLEPDTFRGLSRLRRLSLMSNFLTDLPDGIFSDLPDGAIIELGGNQISGSRAREIRGAYPDLSIRFH